MKLEKLERGNQLLETKKKLEGEIKRVEDTLARTTMTVTRMGFGYETNASYFNVRDREFINQVTSLWLQKLQTRLTEVNLELMAL